MTLYRTKAVSDADGKQASETHTDLECAFLLGTQRGEVDGSTALGTSDTELEINPALHHVDLAASQLTPFQHEETPTVPEIQGSPNPASVSAALMNA